MGFKIFSDSIDVAIVGLTNSGKSTFIASMIDRKKFEDSEVLKELHHNNGGLTKVTTFYELSNCSEPVVHEIAFNFERILDGISEDDIVAMNKRISGDDYKFFKISSVTASEKGDFKDSLNENLSHLADKIKSDIKFAISIINNKKSEKLIKYIKIRVPATEKALKIMIKYGFKTVVLRDTRGFLDTSLSEIEQKLPSLVDLGLDSIQACILMNGQDAPMPSLGREIYGDFVKSIFEAVPTFVVERSGKLAGKLEDYAEDGVVIDGEIYTSLVTNKKVISLNFNEMRKFLLSLGVVKEDGNASNQLIESNKRELLLPEVSVLKCGEVDYTNDEYGIYEFCVMEVLDRLLSNLSEFRGLLNKIMSFFDNSIKVDGVRQSFLDTFVENIFQRIITEYSNYSTSSGRMVRPVTDGYSTSNLLDNLMKKPLLGPRGGITTKGNGQYLYGATGVFAVTARSAINMLVINMKEYEAMINTIENLIDKPCNIDVLNAYTLEIQRCLKYILQNSFTDLYANFGGYQTIQRDKAVTAIVRTKELWESTFTSKFGVNAIDTVHLIKVKNFMETHFSKHRFSDIEYVRFSQLYYIFTLTLEEFFDSVSSNHSRIDNSNIAGR